MPFSETGVEGVEVDLEEEEEGAWPTMRFGGVAKLHVGGGGRSSTCTDIEKRKGNAVSLSSS